MADYPVEITRGLRFSAGRKWNEFVVKRGLKLSAKRRRDDWIQNFGGSGAGVGTGSTKKVRFRFP
jgi:hypothetical protein